MHEFYLVVAVRTLEVVDEVLKQRLSASEERLLDRDCGLERAVPLDGLGREHECAGEVAQFDLGLGNPCLEERVPLRVKGGVKSLRCRNEIGGRYVFNL